MILAVLSPVTKNPCIRRNDPPETVVYRSEIWTPNSEENNHHLKLTSPYVSKKIKILKKKQISNPVTPIKKITHTPDFPHTIHTPSD